MLTAEHGGESPLVGRVSCERKVTEEGTINNSRNTLQALGLGQLQSWSVLASAKVGVGGGSNETKLVS